LSSFAGSTATATSTSSGFGGLGGSSASSFGGSTFGGSLGGGFGGLGGSKPGASFAAPGGNLEIKGLKEKETPFGAAAIGETSDDEDGDDEDPEKGTDKEERQTSQPLLSQQRMLTLSILKFDTDLLKHKKLVKKARRPSGRAAPGYITCLVRVRIEHGKSEA